MVNLFIVFGFHGDPHRTCKQTNKMAVRNDYFLKRGRLKAVKSEQTTYVRIPYHVTYQGLPGYFV